MLFMLTMQPKPGVTREQLVQYLTGPLNPMTWDVIRKGILSNVLFKTGDELGIFAVLSASNIEEAHALINKVLERNNLLDVQIDPVNQFPHFD